MKTIALIGKRGGETVVDDDVFEWASRFAWHQSSEGYVVRVQKPHTIFLHREILGLTRGDGVKTDHRDRDRLNNQRSNLRPATAALSAQNKPGWGRSRFRGVHPYRSKTNPWGVTVQLAGTRHWLGCFPDEVSAARVAEAFRRKHMPYAEPDPELLKLNPTEETT